MLRTGRLSIAFVFLVFAVASAASGGAWAPGPSRDSLPASAFLAIQGPPAEEDGIRLLEDRLFQEAFKARAWKLLERKRVDALLAERAFQASTDQGPTAEDIGSLLGVRTLLVPEYERTDGVVYLSLREIEVSSGAVLRLAEAQTEASLSEASRSLARLLIGRLLEDPSVPASDSGTLEIVSDPPATVWIDGEEAGSTPLRVAAWPGLHRVAVVPGQTLPPPPEQTEPDVRATTVIIVHDDHHHGPGRPQRHHLRSDAPSNGGSSSSSDHAGQVVGGAIAAAAGVALVAAAVSMPDSVWSETWVDVRVKPGHTAKAEFRREENGGRVAVGVLGAVVLFLGAALLVLAASGD